MFNGYFRGMAKLLLPLQQVLQHQHVRYAYGKEVCDSRLMPSGCGCMLGANKHDTAILSMRAVETR